MNFLGGSQDAPPQICRRTSNHIYIYVLIYVCAILLQTYFDLFNIYIYMLHHIYAYMLEFSWL